MGKGTFNGHGAHATTRSMCFHCLPLFETVHLLDSG